LRDNVQIHQAQIVRESWLGRAWNPFFEFVERLFN